MRRLMKLFLLMILAEIVGTIIFGTVSVGAISAGSRMYKYSMGHKTITIMVPDSFIVGYIRLPDYTQKGMVFFPNEKMDFAIMGLPSNGLCAQDFTQIDTLIEDSLFRMLTPKGNIQYYRIISAKYQMDNNHNVISEPASLSVYTDDSRSELLDTIFRSVIVEDRTPNNDYPIAHYFQEFRTKCIEDSVGYYNVIIIPIDSIE